MANLLIKRLVFFVCCWLLVVGLPGCGDLEGAVTSITVSPSTITVGVNQPQYFSVIAKDANGQIVTVTPTWSVTGGIGSITSGGIFTATSTAASGYVVATVNSISGRSAVTITSLGWVEGRVSDNIGNRVNGIKVYLKNTSPLLLDFADSNGDYSIENVPAGHYEVWTDESSTIYIPASVEATVSSGEKSQFHNFTLYYFTDPPDTTPPELTP